MRNFVFSVKGSVVLSIIFCTTLGLILDIQTRSIIIKTFVATMLVSILVYGTGAVFIKSVNESIKENGELSDFIKGQIRIMLTFNFAFLSYLLINTILNITKIANHAVEIAKLEPKEIAAVYDLKYMLYIFSFTMLYAILYILFKIEPTIGRYLTKKI